MNKKNKSAVATKKEITKEEFLGALMYWCFKWGCEVRLLNRAMDFAPMNPNRVIEMPELNFSKDNRCISIAGHDWDDLMRIFQHQYMSIFMELSVPYFNPREK